MTDIRKVVQRKLGWTPEQQAVLPRRLREYGNKLKAYERNPSWIKNGVVEGEEEICPWLHEFQQGGYKICVLGCSVSACAVCAEAYESGFQPVLVLLEDKIPAEKKDFTMKVANVLLEKHFRSGMLNCGFEVIIAASAEIRINLGATGEASDLKLVPKTQRYDVRGNPIDYEYQGPVLVIDMVVDPSMVGGALEVDSLVAFHKRFVTESKAVTAPEFWEQRYDPECRTFATPTFSDTIPGMCVIGLQWGLCFTVYKFHYLKEFIFIRAAVDLGHRLIMTAGAAACILEFNGMDVPRSVLPLYSIVPFSLYSLLQIGLCFIHWDHRAFFSDFAVALVGVTAAQFIVQTNVHFFSNKKLGLWQLFWGYAAVFGTAGSWFQCMPIMLMYQYLLSESGVVASVYLTVALAFFEIGMIKYLAFAYSMAARKRKEDPLQISADQKMSLSFSVACTHCFFETAKLASLICGAVGAETVRFLGNVGVSLSSSILMNSAFRTGFMTNQLVKIPWIGRKVCPNGVWMLHNNVKFCMGWCRFFNVFGLLLCRGLIHGRWAIKHWEVKDDYGVWCWSGIVLATILLAFSAEVLEDIIVYRTCHSTIPIIRGNVYKEVMVDRLNNPRTTSRCHIVHYWTPPPVQSGRHSLVNNEFVLGPNLNNVRPISQILVLCCGAANGVLLSGLISVGVGSGNMFGFCRPLDLKKDEFVTFLKNFYVWSFDCRGL